MWTGFSHCKTTKSSRLEAQRIRLRNPLERSEKKAMASTASALSWNSSTWLQNPLNNFNQPTKFLDSGMVFVVVAQKKAKKVRKVKRNHRLHYLGSYVLPSVLVAGKFRKCIWNSEYCVSSCSDFRNSNGFPQQPNGVFLTAL